MRILLDECVPVQLRPALPNHEVTTVQKMGWSGKENGDLLNAAEQAGFHVLILADKNLRYQQNLTGRMLAILILPTTSWPVIQKSTAKVLETVNALKQGGFVELQF